MSRPIENLIQIAVHSAAEKSSDVQRRILSDCFVCADTPDLRESIRRLGQQLEDFEANLRTFESSPDEDQI